MEENTPNIAGGSQRSGDEVANSSSEAEASSATHVFWSPQSVRRFMVGVMLALVLQYAAVGIVGELLREPWPTLVLPAFQSVWDGDEELAVPRARLVAVSSDGTQLEVPFDAVWSTIPASQQAGFMREQCRPQSLSGTTRTERCTAPEARSWIRTQLQDHLLPSHVERLDVVWEEVIFNVSKQSTAQSARTQPIDTLRISL